MNTFGNIFRLTDFGESHGKAYGGIIDGVPPGIILNTEFIQHKIDMRRPGTDRPVSQRKESDYVEWLSGINNDGKTLGSPIGFIVYNQDAHPDDYINIENTFRPGHADYTTYMKYGIRDYRGGGRSSARQTLCRVIGGAVAEQILLMHHIEIRAFISGVGPLKMDKPYSDFPNTTEITDSPIFCPDSELSSRIIQFMYENPNDSIGGRVSLICKNVPPGLGNPVYGKLSARLASAMMGINAAKGVDIGLGYKAAEAYGHDAIDTYTSASIVNSKLRLKSGLNLSGGIDGGISNGEDINLSVYFKPTPTRPYIVNSYNLDGEPTLIHPKGRHDLCVAIRAVPVVQAMAALVILDELMIHQSLHINENIR